MHRRFLRAARSSLVLLILTAAASPSDAATLRVAVAANFADTMRVLAARFEREGPHHVDVIAGSTGKLTAQIVHGAPFDLFFAADAERPRMLEEAGETIPETRRTYARGRLALWAPGVAGFEAPEDWLRTTDFTHLALANPRLAPYGAAAAQVLSDLDLWEFLQPRLVRGENIAQVYQFVSSGGADAGFVALSQLRQPGRSASGAVWVVPETDHASIDQQRVMLRDSPAARAFLAMVEGPAGRDIVESFGYSLAAQTSAVTRSAPPPPLSDDDLGALRLTLSLAAVTTALLLLFGTPLAWWLARTKSRLRVLVEAVVALPIVLPPTVLGFYLLLFLGPKGPLGSLLTALGGSPLVFRFEGLVLGSLVYSLPFVVQPLQAAFEAIDDRLLEAAATLRASPFDTFRAVVVPVARPGFVTATVLGFAHTLGEFGVVLMVGGNIPGETKVLSIAIYDHVETLDFARAHTLAGGMLALSFTLLLVVYMANSNLRMRRR